MVDVDRRYQYDEVLEWVTEAMAPLGPDYVERMRRGFAGRWIDVYESPGKGSGA